MIPYRHWSVNACLLPVCSLDGLAITTIEGIGNTRKLHPCQVSFASCIMLYPMNRA